MRFSALLPTYIHACIHRGRVVCVHSVIFGHHPLIHTVFSTSAILCEITSEGSGGACGQKEINLRQRGHPIMRHWVGGLQPSSSLLLLLASQAHEFGLALYRAIVCYPVRFFV